MTQTHSHAATEIGRDSTTSGFSPTRVALEIKDLYLFSGVLRAFVERDLRIRYRQTALGAIWIIAQPLIGAGLFTLVLGRVAHFSAGHKHYFLFTFSAMTIWTAFTGSLTRTMVSLQQNGPVVSKIYFPRLLLAFGSWLSSLVDAFVSTVALLICSIITLHTFRPVFVLVPVVVLLSSMLGSGIGMIIAGPLVLYRDISYIVPVLLQFLLFAIPIAYGPEDAPKSLQSLYQYNPIANAIQLVRQWILSTPGVHTSVLVESVAMILVTVALGIRQYRKNSVHVVDFL